MENFPQGNNKSRMDRVRDALYSPKAKISSDIERNVFSSKDEKVASEWQSRPDMGAHNSTSSLVKKFFLGSIIFFVVAVLVAGYILFGGGNTISSDKINILVQGPVSASGGKVTSFDVIVENKNNVPLENTNLVVEFPQGTRSEKNLNTEYSRVSEKVGTIAAAGGKVEKTFSAVLFGEKDETKNITVILEYSAKGSSAVLTKKKLYDVVIGSSPVTVTVNAVSETTSNQEVVFDIGVESNSNSDLKNLLLRMDTPSGFTMVSATPAVNYNPGTWSLNTLKPEEKKVIRVVGRIEGQDGDEKVFRFRVGQASETDEKIISADFVLNTHSIAIKKPFIGSSISINNEGGTQTISRFGQTINGDLQWYNNTSFPINDVEIELKINGDIFDRTSVGTDGFFRSQDNTIVWNQNNTRDLERIAPGDSGSLDFRFMLKRAGIEFSRLRSPSMTFDVTIRGNRMSGDSVAEEVKLLSLKKILIATDISIGGKTFYYSGPFRNTGPIPSRAEHPTTYTIVWTVGNTYNNVSNVVVTADLPEYVKWLGVTSPNTEGVQFNPVGQKLTWNVGSVSSGAGSGIPAREVYFQVEITPSLSHVGRTPVLVRNIELIGRDDFTGETVGSSRSDMTVDISSDPMSTGRDYSVKN